MIPKFYPTSLRSRAVAVVLMAFMPLWALSLWSYFEQRDRAIREMQRDELVTVRYMANVQETLFNDTKQFLMTLARLPEVQRLDREACSALFAQLLEQNPSRFTIVAADAEGRLLASAPAAPGPVTYADRPWFQKVKQSRDLVLGEITIGHVSGKYGCNLAYPILDGEGPFLGALTSQLNLDWMGSLLAKSNFPPSTGLVLTDISRKIIFRYPEPEKYIGQMLPEAFIKPMTSQDEGVAEGIGLPRDERLFAFARLAPPWQELWVTIGLPREWVVTPIHRALWRNLMWLGLVTLVALAVAWYGAGWWVVSPVRELRVITDRLAAGDLRVRAGPDYRVGELGLLARDFDQMAAALQDREAAIKKSNAELERSNRELEEFAYIASHDLQEPLRKIANFSEMLALQYQDRLDEQGVRYFGYIRDGAKRMQGLINDLLTYSRVGRAEMPKIQVSLEDILQGTMNELQPLIKESGAEISHNFLPTLKVNPHQMGQVLQNLIANAIKFKSDQPPLIDISAKQEGREWVIAVRDNGIGFDPEFAGQIFKMFKRLHTKEVYPGTGIGLAICKKIVERHGGRIWAESQPGQGTTFFFSIPA